MKTLSHEEELRSTVRLMKIAFKMSSHIPIPEDDVDFLLDYFHDHTCVLDEQYSMHQIGADYGEEFSRQYLEDVEFIGATLYQLMNMEIMLPNEPRGG